MLYTLQVAGSMEEIVRSLTRVKDILQQKMHSNQLERYKQSLRLTRFQKQVLVGSILGDGSLALMPNGKSARLRIEQSYSHRDYVDWLYGVFHNWTNKNPKLVNRTVWGKIYSKYLFQTFSHPQLLDFHRMFYREKSKIIPLNIDKLLTPLAFTVWFMDDGSKKSNECNGRLICTHGFRLAEIKILVKTLLNKFRLNCWPRYQRDGFEIYISAKSAKQLYSLSNPYICDSMRYKLPVVAV